MDLETTESSNENAPFTLVDCENVIAHGLSTFLEVGAALLTIRNERLYLENGPSFERYCREKWQIGRRHAYTLMNSAVIANNLCSIEHTPTHESQLRPLFGLSIEQQQSAWSEAVSQSPNPTAKQVKAAVRVVAPEIEIARLRAAHGAQSTLTVFQPEPGREERCRALIELATPEISELVRQFIDWPDVCEDLRKAIRTLKHCWSALEQPVKQAS